MSSLGKRNRDDDDNAPPLKKQRTDTFCKNVSNDSLSGLSSLPIAAENKVIVLNVGNVKYTTTLNTLTGYESMLKARFSGNYSMETMDDGSYFFDRDGDLFQYILKYLRTGKLRIPEKWTKTELCSFHDEVEYFAVTSLLTKLALRFFDSKILTHDAMKQKLITTITAEAEDAHHYERYVLPTKEWVLQFEYNRSTETQRDQKKSELLEIIFQGQLTLTLILADGYIYGRFRPSHFEKNSWMVYREDCTLTFCWPSPENLLNPQDPRDELDTDLSPGNGAMTSAEMKEHEAPRHWFWISAKHPHAVAATAEECYDGDFTIKAIDEKDSSSKIAQRIEVWNIPSSRCSL